MPTKSLFNYTNLFYYVSKLKQHIQCIFPIDYFKLQAGYTWDSLNTYENPTISIVYRYTHMGYALSTLLNPIIYLYIYKDFRVAFMRVFGGSGSFSWEENKHSEIGTQ